MQELPGRGLLQRSPPDDRLEKGKTQSQGHVSIFEALPIGSKGGESH